MFLISIIVVLLVLLSLDKPLFSFNAPSCRSTTYRNLFLLLLILLFFIIFEFYFIIILPREFFKVKLVNKIKQASRIVKFFNCCSSNFSFYVYKKISCLIFRSLPYLNFYPCEVFALWYFVVRLIVCPDINPNPGPPITTPHCQNNLFNFMSWNLNSLAKDNFQRVSLIEAHNSIFNYDVITDHPNLILASGTRSSLDPYCHHQIIYCKVNFRIPPPPPIVRKIWHFNRANSTAIKRSMTSFPWSRHLNLNTDTNWQVKTFTSIFLNIMSNFIPNETKRFVPRDSPWITKTIKTLLNKKNRLFNNYKKYGYKKEDKDRLDTFRMECQQSVETSKLNYLKNLGNKVNHPNSSQKSYWKIINRVMNKCRAPKVPPLLVNNMFILNCREKAKLFNDFFSKQCTPITTSSLLPALNLLTDKKIDHISILRDEIISLIRNINPNKASGSDGISGQMLLLCDNSVVLPLKIIFHNILVTSTYPDLWKLANITPIFKKGDKQLIKNNRPISLLPICGKIFEKIIFNNLYSYLNANNLITKNQSGFRPGDSTTNQLLYLVNEIHEAFEDPQSLEVRAVFLDISKAFDKVWHEGLIFKLKRNGVSGSLLKLFVNYLHNRKQRVVLNGFQSDYSLIESGVPQGSVLGPFLFLMYINDLERNITSNIKFFADDTMLFSIVKDPTISANDLNRDLNMICQWAHEWKLEFNPDPTKQANEILFSYKKSSTNHPQLLFNGTAVVKVNEQKHLGLILETGLSFEKHINEKIIKAKQNTGILKHLSNFSPLKTLDQMYKALVRPHLDYCDIIYHIPSIMHQPPLGRTLNILMEKVERVQYQPALPITGAWQGSSRSKIYDELGWETLSDRRKCRRVLQIH